LTGLPVTTAIFPGVAGHDRGTGLPHVHGIGVHDPGHGLFVSINVGGGDILFRADKLEQFGGVAARHALQFALRHFVRIANDSTLGAAKGNIHYRAFPGHPARERADFVEIDVRPIAQSTLGRPSRNRVLHAESSENLEVPIIHRHRDVHNDFAAGAAQHLPQALVEIQLMRRQIEAGGLRLPRISFLFQIHCSSRHKVSV
jgi:hypothetical protein